MCENWSQVKSSDILVCSLSRSKDGGSSTDEIPIKIVDNNMTNILWPPYSTNRIDSSSEEQKELHLTNKDAEFSHHLSLKDYSFSSKE